MDGVIREILSDNCDSEFNDDDKLNAVWDSLDWAEIQIDLEDQLSIVIDD